MKSVVDALESLAIREEATVDEKTKVPEPTKGKDASESDNADLESNDVTPVLETLVVTLENVKALDFTHAKKLGFPYKNALEEFANTVSPADLQHVTDVIIRLDRHQNYQNDPSMVAHNLLGIFKELKNLETLDINANHFQKVPPITTICQVGHTLKTLVLLDDEMRYGRDPVSAQDLKELKQHCPILENLTVNLLMFPYHDVGGYVERSTFEPEDFLNIVAQFENLRVLHLYEEHSAGTEDPKNSSSTDPDYDDVVAIFEKLVEDKAGVRFEKVIFTLDRSFQPRNFRFPYKWFALREGSPNPRDYWPARREFRITPADGTDYEMKTEKGCGRVDEIPDGSVDPNETETYKEYLESNGDGLKKHYRPKFNVSVLRKDGVDE